MLLAVKRTSRVYEWLFFNNLWLLDLIWVYLIFFVRFLSLSYLLLYSLLMVGLLLAYITLILFLLCVAAAVTTKMYPLWDQKSLFYSIPFHGNTSAPVSVRQRALNCWHFLPREVFGSTYGSSLNKYTHEIILQQKWFPSLEPFASEYSLHAMMISQRPTKVYIIGGHSGSHSQLTWMSTNLAEMKKVHAWCRLETSFTFHSKH